MKKAFTLFLSFLMAFCCTISTLAADDTGTQQVPYIEARFTDFANVNIFLTEDDYGFLHVEGSAGTSSSENYVKITVSLEQYMTEGFEPLGDNFVWTAEGYFGAMTQATRSVSRGSYRARIDAECWRDGVLKESLTFYSDIVNISKK